MKQEIKMRKTTILAIAASGLAVTPAMAMQGFSTCHAPQTTVISISGFDTRTAKMTDRVTRPDAMEYCHREPDALESGDADEHFINMNACADRIMRTEGTTVTTAWANCEKATLTVQYSPVPESVYYSGKGSIHVDHYKFPVIASCGGDNMAAIAAFKQMCPSYTGKVEK
jgi:hypothetical protein